MKARHQPARSEVVKQMPVESAVEDFENRLPNTDIAVLTAINHGGAVFHRIPAVEEMADRVVRGNSLGIWASPDSRGRRTRGWHTVGG